MLLEQLSSCLSSLLCNQVQVAVYEDRVEQPRQFRLPQARAYLTTLSHTAEQLSHSREHDRQQKRSGKQSYLIHIQRVVHPGCQTVKGNDKLLRIIVCYQVKNQVFHYAVVSVDVWC